MMKKEKNAFLTLKDSMDFLDYDDIITLKYIEDINKNYEIHSSKNSIILLIKGHKILHYNNKEYEIKEDEIIFLRNGNVKMSNTTSQESGYYQSYCVLFSNMFLFQFINKHRYLLDMLENNIDGDIFKIKTDMYIKEQIRSLDVYLHNKDKLNTNLFKEVIKLKAETLFLLLMNREDKVFPSFIWSILDSFPFDLKLLLSKGNQEFSSVKEMADIFDMNISLFSKKFKTSFGISPKEWLDNEKFEKAKLLIEFSNKNVTEICKELQINSVAWFIERFKKKYGTTPKKLQKNNSMYFK